jgi:nucleoside-diphosphate kinase
MDARELEQTLVLIKPDALKNSLTGYVLSLLSEFHTGLHFAGTKVVHVSRMLAEEHYVEHRGKSFFPSLIEYITGNLHYPESPQRQRVIAIVYQGPEAVKKLREVCGPTSPQVARDTRPGCIRSLGAVVPVTDRSGAVIGQRMDNLIHASANAGDAEREIKLWFKPCDIPLLMHAYPAVDCDEHYYYAEGALYTEHVPSSVCVLAPGEFAWQSDLDALRFIQKGRTASCTLEAIVAKYLT